MSPGPRPAFEGTRAFLAVWVGLTVSQVGSALTGFAIGVRVFQQTHSTAQYALVMFCATVPPLVLLPLAGPILDRLSRRSVLVLCELIGGLATALVGVLAWRGPLALAAVCALQLVIASAAALQWPAYSAAVPLLVPSERLGWASGLTQVGQSVSQIVSPLLAGALVVAIGLPGIAALDVVTFALSVLALALVAIPRPPGHTPARAPYLRDLASGWQVIFANAGLATLLVMFALTNFLAELASVLFTPFVLGFSTPTVLGTILSVGGVGMLAGGLVLAMTGGPRRPARGAAAFWALAGVAVALAGVARSLPLLATAVTAFFFFLPLTAGASQVAWQRAVPLDVQGRVFAVRGALGMSVMPLASLAAGPLVERVLGPALRGRGALAPLLGPWLGAGPGRGIALIFLLCGAGIALIAAAAFGSTPLRRLDDAAATPGAQAPEPITP